MRLILLIFFIMVTRVALGQSDPLQEGNKCFVEGDYRCAVEKYNVALAASDEKTKKIAGYNIQLARKCMDWLSQADSLYTTKKYPESKQLYELIYAENTKDQYVIERLRVLNNPRITLSVNRNNILVTSAGGEEVVSVTTNADNYSVDSVPSWCSVNKYVKSFVLLISDNPAVKKRNADISVVAGGTVQRISLSQEGKSVVSLSVSTDSIGFNSEGGASGEILVNTNAYGYAIDLLPAWCSVQKFEEKFILSCSSNDSSLPRRDWFYVSAGGKEVKVLITQLGRQSARKEEPVLPSNTSQSGRRKCFNCPKTNDTWGLTAGYAQLDFKKYKNYDGFMFGMRMEPLFKWGFGLNTGLCLYSYQEREATEGGTMQFDYYGINVPLHLEYRLNFSKWFNLFSYAGLGFTLITDTEYEISDLPATFEFGGGFRTGHVQVNIGQSLFWGDYRYSNQIGEDIRLFQNLTIALSYMF